MGAAKSPSPATAVSQSGPGGGTDLKDLGHVFSSFAVDSALAESIIHSESGLTDDFHYVESFQLLLKVHDVVKTHDIERQAAVAITACLQEASFIRVKSARECMRRRDAGADLVLNLRTTAGSSSQIIVEVKTSGQPRLAREAVNQLLRLRSEFPDAYGVFVAPYVSPEAAEICRKDGIGYLDLAGNCRLSFDQVFISREGFRNQFTQRRDLRSLYAPKATRVLRVLLMGKSTWWKTQALADEAGVSIGQVANVKKNLRDREWVAEGKEGFRLASPQALLREWAQNYTYRKNTVRDFYAMAETDQVEAVIAKACRELGIEYAFTGFSAARRIAPAVRGQRAMAYVGTISETLLKRAGLKEVSSGANVSLLVPYDEGVYYMANEVDSMRTVCPIQLYLDLKGYKGRGDEAAEAVWQQEISKLW